MINLTKHNLIVAGFASVYFIIFSLPMVYALTSKAVPAFMDKSAPSLTGIVAHAVVLFLAMFGTMMSIEKMIKDNIEKSS